MPSRRTARLIPILILFTAVVALASSRCPDESVGPEILLPADQTAVLRASSLDELHRAWGELMSAFRQTDALDLKGEIATHAPELSAVLDPSRPFGMSARVLPVMMQQEPFWTGVLPLTRTVADPATLIDAHDVAAWAQDRGYLAFSTDPDYAAAAPVPDLALGMIDATVAVRADLRRLIEENRMVMEMGLMGMSAQAQQDEPQPGMPSPDEMEAMADMARSLADALDTMDLGVDVEAGEFRLRSEFRSVPGSVLELGPQRPLADALALARRLPRDADIVMASAFDQSRSMEFYEEYTRISLASSLQVPDEKQEELAAWIGDYMALIDLYSRPYASALWERDGVMEAACVLASPDAGRDVERMASIIDGFSALGTGLGFAPLPSERTDGVDVRAWKMEIDEVVLAKIQAEHHGHGPGPEQFFETFGNEIRIAAEDDVLLMSFGRGTKGMASLLRGAFAHTRLAELAVRGGPDARQVFHGDYGLLLRMMADMFPGVQDDPGAVIPFHGVTTAAGTVGGLDVSVDLEGMPAVMGVLDELEAMEDSRASQ